MARKKKSGEAKRHIESYEHRDKERLNNPPVGLVTPKTDPDAGQKKKMYQYDPHLDPQLVWAGKAEHTAFEVPTVSLHVHERIDPRTILDAVKRRNGSATEQPALFELERQEPLRQAIEFYQHKHGWTNRLIAGDSLLVMNSLLEKEGLAGKVQMIYIDPPYGIKYGSNFQPFVNKRDVKDGKDEDLTAEPEQIRAFRDTWELGIHSYLTYLRDRLLLARELLTESGSIFVQISDENVHHVRELMDEVFGAGNFVALIPFRKKTMPLGARYLDSMNDYLLFYSKDKKHLKYRNLYQAYEPDGKSRWVRDSMEGEWYRLVSSRAPGYSPELDYAVAFEGEIYSLNKGQSWIVSKEKLVRLVLVGRMKSEGKTLSYRLLNRDFPYQKITNLWTDTTGPMKRVFIVETSQFVVQRCLLMTTDPGDLVFDPTCGSGTTAYVAEQWGRRWITCDTSRVAITIAKQRLMTAVFDYYELAHPEEGVGSGFRYKTVPHVTLKSIANNPEIDGIYERMHPDIEQALADLNAALKGQRVKFEVTQGGRAEQVVDFAAPDSDTFTMPSGQVVKVNELVEWEVPFEFPDAWPEKAREPFEAFHAARRAMQNAMDEAIARHAPQETLYDQPYVDSKKVRVTGPFTVEAVPAPAVKSVDDLLPSPQPSPSGRGGDEKTSPTGRGSTGIPLPPGEGGRRPGEGKKPLPEDLLEFARQLRKEQTDAERLMWSLLRDRRLAGFKFRRQHPVERYILDFYCHEARLAVELDGGQHNEPDARARDEQRASFLEARGIRVLRFWNNDVLNNTEGVLQAIYDALTPTLFQRDREFTADLSIARSGETLRQTEWRDELLKTGIRGKNGQRIRFSRLETLPGCRWLHAIGETKPSDEGANTVRESAPAYDPMRAVVSFGPEHGPLEQRQVELAIEEAQKLVPKPKLVVFAAFQFDPEAAKDIDETNWPGVTLLKVQMNADLLTEDLKKKRASNDSFWLIGQPDVEVRQEKDGKYVVEVHGFDYYNTKTGQIESGSSEKIAVWLLDTDYDGRSLYPRQVFFPMADEKGGWARLAKNLRAEIDEGLIEAYRGTVSLPFEAGDNKRIAVKIVDDRGIESLKVIGLE